MTLWLYQRKYLQTHQIRPRQAGQLLIATYKCQVMTCHRLLYYYIIMAYNIKMGTSLADSINNIEVKME